MSKPRLMHLKCATSFLLVGILCTACGVPDISEFTKESAEMTRGIRHGVRDTQTVIKSAAARDDLFSDETLAKLQTNSDNFQVAIKPTLDALDALDSYLEALNALAQANKKSGENASAVVTSVGNLVTAVSGLPFASSAVNVATGLLTLEEQFRTSNDFKKRVNLLSEIVEGRFVNKRDATGKEVIDSNGKPVSVKACVGTAEDQITKNSADIKKLFSELLEKAQLTDDQKKTLKPMSPTEKRAQLKVWGKMTAMDESTISEVEKSISSFGCGAIDLIKFSIKDLKVINLAVSEEMYTNAREKNRVVLGFYENIVANDRRIQNELDRILDYKRLVPITNEYANAGADSRAVQTKLTLKDTLNSIFILDSVVAAELIKNLENCMTCGPMLAILQTPTDRAHCDQTCRNTLLLTVQKMTRSEFDNSDSLIEPVLDKKAAELFGQNQSYLTELERIKPSYELASAELQSMKDKQDQLDALLDSSVRALDTWAKTHANLRVAVNTKRPLTISNLASDVRDIWAIASPGTK